MRSHELAVGLVAVAALAIALVGAVRDAWRRGRVTRARERGAAGEARAGLLLQRLGFAIRGRQVSGRYGLGVDGRTLEVALRADYLVEADGRSYVAEVKTGTLAPRLDTAATRRQLLEYRLAFDVDGVLLVDADAGRVRLVEFPLPVGPVVAPVTGRAIWLLAGVAVGAAGALGALAFLDRAR